MAPAASPKHQWSAALKNGMPPLDSCTSVWMRWMSPELSLTIVAFSMSLTILTIRSGFVSTPLVTGLLSTMIGTPTPTPTPTASEIVA